MIAQNNETQGMNNGGIFDAAMKRRGYYARMLNYADFTMHFQSFLR